MESQPADVVSKAQRGDAQAFARLVALYERAGRRVAWQILGNLPDAEDALQEAWMVAWQRLASLREYDRFGPWLYRVVANVSLRKRQQRAARARVDVLRHLAMDCVTDAGPGRVEPEASAMHAQLLPAAMEALSAKDRLVVTLHYLAGVPVEQVARLLDIPAGTVKSRLFHARQTIRKEIEMADRAKRPEHVPADFRQVIQGMHGDIPWQPLLADDVDAWRVTGPPLQYVQTSLSPPPPGWQRVQDGMIGDDPRDGQGSCILFGSDAGWVDYEVSMLVTPLAGGNIQVFFRVQQSPFQGYVFDMMLGWQTADIHKLEAGAAGQPRLTRLSVVNYPLEHQREYAISIAARGQSLTTYIDGALVNQVTDGSIPAGGIGLNVWQSKTLFRDIKVRHMS